MSLPADVQLAIYRIEAALDAHPDAETVAVEFDRGMLRLFKEFCHDFDPDMPPRPLCKALGPLVGDYMLGTKLDRLDAIADKLGPLVMLLAMYRR